MRSLQLPNIRVKAISELIDRHLLPRPHGSSSTESLRGDEDIFHIVDNPILRDAIRNRNAVKGIGINPKRDEATPSRDIDAQTLIPEQRRQIDMEFYPVVFCVIRIFDALLVVVLGPPESIRVQRLIGNDVILEERGQVLFAIFTKQEGVDLGAEFPECRVRGRKEDTAGMWTFCDHLVQTGLHEGELEGGELAGEKLDDCGGGRGWEEDRVDAVDDAVCAEL